MIKGIDRLTFSNYYELPGIIIERVFDVFDVNNNSYIDFIEFFEGMMTLFAGNYDDLTRFVFILFDFNNDGYISSEDIRLVLSYIPINNDCLENAMLKFEKYNYKDRVDSQVELHELLDRSFVGGSELDYEGYLFVVEHICSDIFIYLVIFLLEKRPFSRLSLKRFDSLKSFKNCYTPEPIPTKKMISPNLHSKFSPSLIISKTPYIRQKFGIAVDTKFEESKNLLLRYTTKQSDCLLLSSPVNIRKKKSNLTAKFLNLDSQLFCSPNKKFITKEFHTSTSKELKSLSNENNEYFYLTLG
jgi:Ca2+-binding EF-hand superfamily protein